MGLRSIHLTSLYTDSQEINIINVGTNSLCMAESGVEIDKETRYTAGIMLLSLIPYVVVQLVDISNTSSVKRIITLIALIISSLSLLSYFAYQVN